MKLNMRSYTVLILLTVIFLTTGCDDGVVTPGLSDATFTSADPTVPPDFNEIQFVDYRGDDPENLEDLMTSLGYGLGNTSFSYLEFLDNNRNEDLESLLDLFSYNSDSSIHSLEDYTVTPGINIDKKTLTGSVSATLNEKILFDYIKGTISAFLEHSNIFSLNEKTYQSEINGTTFEYVAYDYAPVYPMDSESSDSNSLPEGGFFTLSLDIDDFDIKMRNAQGAEGFVTEYFRCRADIELLMSGDSITVMSVSEQDGKGFSFSSGSINCDLNLKINAALVFSSSVSDVKGCKAICTIELKESLSDIDPRGIDVFHRESLFDALSSHFAEQSVPSADIAVFDSDNNYLFSEKIPLSSIVHDLFKL